MTRKIIYSIDVLLCCIFLMFAYHYQFYYDLPWLNITITGTIFAVLPIMLRMNVSFLLYRKERKAYVPIVVFMALFIYLFYYTYANHLAWRYAMNWLHSVYDESFYVPMNEQVITKWGAFRWENAAVIILNLWTLLMPIVAYTILKIKKRLVGNETRWYRLLLTYMFHDKAGKSFLPMLAVVCIGYLLGKNTKAELSAWGIAILPTIAYVWVSKHLEYKPKWWEYVLLVASLCCFNDSQYFWDTPRIIMLISSAIGILIVCVRLAMATRQWFVSFGTYLLIAFLLPVLTLGYNIYVGTDCGRFRNYTDDYITRGVMYVRNDSGQGMRSRYRVVMPPKFKKMVPVVVPDIYRWNVSETGDSTKILVRSAKLREVMGITADNDTVLYSPKGDYYIDPSTNEWRWPTKDDLK